MGTTTDTISQINYMYLIHADTSGNITTSEYTIPLPETIILFPNPTSEIINIQPFDNSVDNLLEIYNTIGELILRQKFKGAETISMEDQPNGVYYLKISSGLISQVKRIVVSR